MAEFRTRLDAYQRGAPAGQKNAPYHNFIGGIETMGSVEPCDRIGIRFRDDGLAEIADLQAGQAYLVDTEIWDLGERRLRKSNLEDIVSRIQQEGNRR